MAFKDIANAFINFDNDFSTFDKNFILEQLEIAYNKSTIFKGMIDTWTITGWGIDYSGEYDGKEMPSDREINRTRGKINIHFYENGFKALAGTGNIYIDLSYLEDKSMISPNGKAVAVDPLSAIIHELVHALKGTLDLDGAAVDDYAGPTVDFTNTIRKELGLTQRLSYTGMSSTLVRNFEYTNGTEIDNAFIIGSNHPSVSLGLYPPKDWDSSATGEQRDLLIGDHVANELNGGNGGDFLYGDRGDDKLIGDKGDDFLVGGKGNDTLYGGDGEDILYASDKEGQGYFEDTLFGGANTDLLFGQNGDDILDGGTGNDTMTGGDGNDIYYVDSASDVIVEN